MQRKNVNQLEDSVIMYGMYPMESIDKMLSTTDAMYNKNNFERLFTRNSMN